MAATPVGATTAIFLKLFSRIYFRKVVFPVPAFPVRKTDLPVWLTNFTAKSKMGLLISVTISDTIKETQFSQKQYASWKIMGGGTGIIGCETGHSFNYLHE